MRYQERFFVFFLQPHLSEKAKHWETILKIKMDAIDRNVVFKIICSLCLIVLVVSR